MNDRRLTVLLAVQITAVALLTAILVVIVVHDRASSARGEALLQELRDARQARYEYKVLVVEAEGRDRTGADAMLQASVTPDESALTSLGSAGWEVVGSYLEHETAFPNFGNDKYVTGLQPNVRPQRVVLVLRRRVA